MKKFINRSLIFLVVLITILSLSALIYHNYKSKILVKDNFKISNDINTLIIGDSHAETTLNDKIIPNSRNIAFHAEHYLFTYYKLKKVIEANPQIKKVILSLAPHNLSEGADVTIFSLGRNSRSFARYFMLLNREGVDDTYSPTQNWRINYLKWRFNIPFQLKLEAKLLLKAVLNKTIVLGDFPFIGEYYSSSKHVFMDVKEPINGHYYQKGKLLSKSELSIKYLYKIIDLCAQEDLELILVNTPQHYMYRELIPEYFRDLYSKTIQKIKTDYKDIRIIDYSNYSITDEDFGDYHHVNTKGAEKVSNAIKEQLR